MHPIMLIPIFLGASLIFLAIQITRERLRPTPPRPTYYVKHPDGSFTEANPQP